MSWIIRAILALLVLGCSKKEEPAPGASIKLRYEAEGGVTLEAVSLNASDFSWDMGDGYTYNLKTVSHMYWKNGVYNVTLTVKNKRGTAEVKQEVLIGNITGSVLFWTKQENDPSVDLYLDDLPFSGSIEGGITGVPECGDGRGVTYSKLFDGIHKFRAIRRGAFPKEVADTVRVVGGICLTKEVHF